MQSLDRIGRFDAVVGLFAMLEVVTGRRAAGVPKDDENVRKVEGWILGADCNVSRLECTQVKDNQHIRVSGTPHDRSL